MTYTALVVQRAIHAAAELRVADLLRDGARASEDLAAATGTHPGALYRLLRTLASAGVLAEAPGRRFSLTSLGDTLRSDVEGSMLGWVLFGGAPFYLRAWEDVLESVRTGKPAWERSLGAPFFDYLSARPEAREVFDAAMTSLSRWEGPAVADAYDFSPFDTLVDVGGGQGFLLRTILKAYPGLRGVLYDQPQTVEDARRLMESEGLADRCDVVGGDFFKCVPAGNAYILKYVVHDWDDEAAVKILANCRRAMGDNKGKLLLVETVVPGPAEPHYAKIQDLEMLVVLGSRERTREELAELLRRAGFELTRVVPTSEPPSVMESEPV